MKYLILLIFLFSGGAFYGRTSIRPNNSNTRVAVKTISQIDDERLETERLEREAKISKVKKILSKGDPAHQQKAAKYVDAATEAGIEWWLPPSISVLESTGCRYYPRSTFNCWGYGGENLYAFRSIDDGISHVTNALANGAYYRGKTLYQKVTTYNSANVNYYQNLLAVRGDL